MTSAQPLSGDTLISTATVIAQHAHYGQVDSTGSPYVWHALAVARLVPHTNGYDTLPEAYRDITVAAGILHGVLDATSVTSADLLDAGMPGRLVEAVEAMTRRDGETGSDLYRRISEDPIAVVVRNADIAHNAQPDRLNATAAANARLERGISQPADVIYV